VEEQRASFFRRKKGLKHEGRQGGAGALARASDHRRVLGRPVQSVSHDKRVAKLIGDVCFAFDLQKKRGEAPPRKLEQITNRTVKRLADVREGAFATPGGEV